MPGITDPSEEYFKDGLWGWNGSAWRKSGLLFSYTNQLLGESDNANADAGQNLLYGTTVPAGEIWVVTAMMVVNTISQTSSSNLGLYTGSLYRWVSARGVLAASAGHSWSGHIYLVEGDTVVAVANGCTAGDDLFFSYLGYKMTI